MCISFLQKVGVWKFKQNRKKRFKGSDATVMLKAIIPNEHAQILQSHSKALLWVPSPLEGTNIVTRDITLS